MSTKAPRTSSPSSNPNNAFAALNMMSDLARQQLSLMTEASCAVLGNSEALGKIQQQAARQASERYQGAAEMLRAQIEPMDVLTVQSELLREDMQQTAQYWAQLASAAMQSQLELVGRMGSLFGAGSQGGLNSAIDAWRNMVAATPDGSAAARTDVH